jgi:hypothetical protein
MTAAPDDETGAKGLSALRQALEAEEMLGERERERCVFRWCCESRRVLYSDQASAV